MTWLLPTVFVLGSLLLLLSPLKTTLHYHFRPGTDELEIEVSFGWGLLRRKIDIVDIDLVLRRLVPAWRVETELERGEKLAAEEVKKLDAIRLVRQVLKAGRLVKILFTGSNAAVGHLLSRVSIRSFRWQTRLGLEDAASTGLAAGALWAAKGTISALLLQKMKVDRRSFCIHVKAVYNQMVADTYFLCILNITLGDIMVAGLKWLAAIISRGGVRRWRTIQFRG
ncbi:MAG: DUF2953 domain-containing protein [Bacillota bacterium]